MFTKNILNRRQIFRLKHDTSDLISTVKHVILHYIISSNILTSDLQVDEDEPLFLSLISDLFPGINLDSATYTELQSYLKKRIEEAGLINYDAWNLKIVQVRRSLQIKQ